MDMSCPRDGAVSAAVAQGCSGRDERNVRHVDVPTGRLSAIRHGQRIAMRSMRRTPPIRHGFQRHSSPADTVRPGAGS